MRSQVCLSATALLLAATSWVHAQEAPAKPASSAAPAIMSDSPPDSLMFSTDDLTDIQSRIVAGAGGEQSNDGAGIENAALYLSTILFYGPQEWTAWINGTPIGPQQDFQAFRVTDIGPDYVELVVPLSAQGMRPVRLSPNQTFVARTGSVVEGRWNP
jgi:hypothetical protein